MSFYSNALFCIRIPPEFPLNSHLNSPACKFSCCSQPCAKRDTWQAKIMMASAVIYSENILRSIITWAGTQKGVPTPYPHERIQSHRDSPALLFTTHPWRVSSCCLCEQRGSFINRGVEGWAGGSLTSCPGPPFAPPQRAPRSVLDQKKNCRTTAHQERTHRYGNGGGEAAHMGHG